MELFPAFVFGVFGTVLGSFVAVVAERVNTNVSWVTGRSRCNSCAVELAGYQMVPVASWIAMGGRCLSCGSRIPALYLLTEFALGVLFGLSYALLGLSLALALLAAFLVTLAFIVLYDLRHTVIPPQASALLTAFALLYAASVSGSVGEFGLALLSAGGIGLAFVFLHSFSGGRAMGLGDAPLAVALSLVAAPLAVTGLVFSFWIGAVWGLALLVFGRQGTTMKSEVPFAPFLAAGFLLAFYTGWNLFPLALL